MLEALGGPEPAESGVPPTFEELGVDRGLVRYQVDCAGAAAAVRTGGDGAAGPGGGVRDGVAGRACWATRSASPRQSPWPGPRRVELWVESLGRVNYGPRLGEPKGITGGVLHERQYLHGVRARGLRLDAFEEPGAVAGVPFGDAVEGRHAGCTGGRSS